MFGVMLLVAGSPFSFSWCSHNCGRTGDSCGAGMSYVGTNLHQCVYHINNSTVDVVPHTHTLFLPHQQLWTTIALSKVYVFYGSRRPPYLTTFFAVVANLSKSAQLFIFCVCLALPPDVKLCQIAPHVFCVRHKTRHARCDVALFVVGCHRLV